MVVRTVRTRTWSKLKGGHNEEGRPSRACLPTNQPTTPRHTGTRMEDITTAGSTSSLVGKFVAAGRSFVSDKKMMNKLKGELQDMMGWGDMVVVDHTGLVVGIARHCIEGIESPRTLGDHFDSQYEKYLKFAHRHEVVIVVRSDQEQNGICVFSHEALNQATPECHHIIKVLLDRPQTVARAHTPCNPLARTHSPFNLAFTAHALTILNSDLTQSLFLDFFFRRTTSSKRSRNGRRAERQGEGASSSRRNRPRSCKVKLVLNCIQIFGKSKCNLTTITARCHSPLLRSVSTPTATAAHYHLPTQPWR